MRRVVVTGIGMVSPFGTGIRNTWENGVLKSKPAISSITSFDTTNFATKIAGQVPQGKEEGMFDPESVIPVKDIKKMGKFIQLAMVATDEAVKDANWMPIDENEKIRTGVLIGSGIGGLTNTFDTAKTMLEKNSGKCSPFFIPFL